MLCLLVLADAAPRVFRCVVSPSKTQHQQQQHGATAHLISTAAQIPDSAEKRRFSLMSSASDEAQCNDDSRGSPDCAVLSCSAQSLHPFICFVAAVVVPTCCLLTKPNQTKPTPPCHEIPTTTTTAATVNDRSPHPCRVGLTMTPWACRKPRR